MSQNISICEALCLKLTRCSKKFKIIFVIIYFTFEFQFYFFIDFCQKSLLEITEFKYIKMYSNVPL